MFEPTCKSTSTFEDYLARHQEWGYATFGSPAEGRDEVGPLDHIRKEMLEIAHDPKDLKEWTDVIILAIDGLLRAGASQGFVAGLWPEAYSSGRVPASKVSMLAVQSQIDVVAGNTKNLWAWAALVMYAIGGFLNAGGAQSQVLPMLFAKQTKNFGRQWPDWRTMPRGVAIEHVRDEAEQQRKSREMDGDLPDSSIAGPDIYAEAAKSLYAPYGRKADKVRSGLLPDGEVIANIKREKMDKRRQKRKAAHEERGFQPK